MKKFLIIALLVISSVAFAQVKIRDLSDFNGLEPKQLIGYGLIVGLDGTGDGGSSQITIQSIQNMMERFGITVPQNKIRPNNVAAVMITATLPAYAKVGSQFDITVSSIGDAKSLEGGTLLMSALTGIDGVKYATAQGAVSIGGFNTSAGNARIRKNYALVGRIPNGAMVDREFYSEMITNGELVLNLKNPDFTTSQRISEAINKKMNMRLAYSEDPVSVSIIVPDSTLANSNLMRFVSQIENLEITPQQKAKVVINERTGTIVAGGDVKITEIAVTHGNLIIEIAQNTEELSIGPIEEKVEETEIEATTEQARVVVMKAPSVQDLARSLNSIKVTPRDLISIFQSIKAAGALQAELVII